MHPFGCGSVWGGWGNEAINVLSKLSKKVATQLYRPLNEVMSTIDSRLSPRGRMPGQFWPDMSHQPHLVTLNRSAFVSIY